MSRCLAGILILTLSELRIIGDLEQSKDEFNMGIVAVATSGKWDVGDKNRKESHKTAIASTSYFFPTVRLVRSFF